MQRTLQLTIISGPTICYSFEQKRMCEWVRVTGFGTRYHCQLFTGTERQLDEEDGCLQRDPRCIQAERDAAVETKP